MKSFESLQVESDRGFVARILKELAELAALREKFARAMKALQDKVAQHRRAALRARGSSERELEGQIQTLRENFACDRRAWQGRAWAEFVERYSGEVYDQAARLTWREARYQNEEKRWFEFSGKKRALSDATEEAYLWLLEQLQLKLHYYERVPEMPLADFIKMNLRSKNLLIDYLRWHEGYLPKVIAKCSRAEKQVFYGLQLNLSVDQIAATMRSKTESVAERAKLRKKILKTQDEIIAKLKHAGQMHVLDKKARVAIDDENEEFISTPEDWSADDDISLQEVKDCFIAALQKLTPPELSLLQLFYKEKFTTAEILAAYQQAGIKLPHVDKTIEHTAANQNVAASQNATAAQKATADEVRKALEKTRASLLKLFRKECKNLPNATIKSKIVLELLKLLGAILT